MIECNFYQQGSQDSSWYKCGNCKNSFKIIIDSKYNYCPSCGSKIHELVQLDE